MNINTIYPSFDGEVNYFGIGTPTIFVRTQGCHLRCYKDTLGMLCDTPEALDLNKEVQMMAVEDILFELNDIRVATGIRKITLTGGDPLMQDAAELMKLFELLEKNKFNCTVETAGTISILPYYAYKNVHWVLDYKLPSCGVKPVLVERTFKNFPLLDEMDYVKFVVMSKNDLQLMRDIVIENSDYFFQYAAGIFYGEQCELTELELFEYLKDNCLLGKVMLNMQTHKLIMQPKDYKIKIPVEL